MELHRFKAILLPLCTACLLLASWMLFHSLTGVQLAGCGTGSACDSVTGGPWGYFLGEVPVSLPAVAVYLLLIICILFLEDCRSKPAMTESNARPAMTESMPSVPEARHARPDRASLNPLLWRLLPLLGGCLAGAALWFCGLQLFVLHAFCKYCTALHVLGCVVAGVILVEGDPGSLPGMTKKWLWFAAGLVAAALFAVVQVRTRPEAIYDSGRTEALLPTFEEGGVPVLGDCRSEPAMTESNARPAMTESMTTVPEARHARLDRASITLLFDFQCNHCRRLHRILPELLERAGGQFRIFLCPVPLSSACNPYIPAGAVDHFAGSCPLTRYALAVWYTRPDAYAAYWDRLLGGGDERAQVSPDDALQWARELLGDGLDAALADPRIDAYLRKVEEVFGRTSTTGTGGVPRLILGQRWLVPETDDADELLQLIRTELSSE